MIAAARRKRSRSLVAPALVSTVFMLLAGSGLRAQYPTEPPPATELRPLRFPAFREARLDNGMQLVVVESHRLPIVSISLNLDAGSRYAPPGLEGLAEIVSELITKGTESRTAEQIAAQIEGVGGNLIASAGDDFFTLSSTVLADHVDLAFELMGDVLLHATYPETELELARTRYRSTLAAEKSDPNALAGRFFAAAVYGDHPYGRSMTEASLAAISREDVTGFAASRLVPDGALLVVSGDISLDRVRQLTDRHLGAWTGSPPATTVPAPPAAKPTTILLVHRPGSAQSNILVGNLALGPRDSLYYPAVVANRVLGGGADARLFLKLREEKGWTYGAYSSLSRRKDVGFFRANAEVRTEVTDSALVELLHQLRLLQTEEIPDSELANAQGFLVGSFPLTIQTPQQVAAQVARARMLGLADDYLETYRERLAAVDPAAASRAARAVLHPDSAAVVVVGDGQAIYDKLASVAPVRIIDTDGSPLTPEDLTPVAAELEFDRTQLVARRDSFQIVAQGTPLGHSVTAWSEAEDGPTYWEITAIPMMGMTQETNVKLDPATLAAVSVDINGNFGGRTAETHLAYDNGHVTGSAQTPKPTGEIATVDVDTTLATGFIDMNLVQPLLPALALADGASFTVSAFDASENRIKTITLKVTGTQDVTVPAGTFSTFRVEMTGIEQGAVYFVTTDSPRRLVKTEVVGQPIVFELIR